MRLLVLLALLALAAGSEVRAQDVVVIRGVPPAAYGDAATADFDGDGDQDLMVIGQSADGTPVTGLYRFLERIEEPIPRQAPRLVAVYQRFSFPVRTMIAGDVSWADADGDGDPDLLISGTGIDEIVPGQPAEAPATDIYRNEGGTLSIRSNSGLPALSQSSASWTDFDADGDLDLALSGLTASGEPVLGLFEHDGAFGFTPVGGELFPVLAYSLSWGDMDADGGRDLFVAGTRDGQPVIMVLKRQGPVFNSLSIPLPARHFASIAATDWDGDGDSDLLVTGGVLGPDLMHGEATLYLNEVGTFSPLGLTLPGVFSGIADWGDYDLDGDQDLLISGILDLATRDHQKAYIYRREGDQLIEAVSLRGVLFGPVRWFDFDGDGILDILVSGFQEDQVIMGLFQN